MNFGETMKTLKSFCKSVSTVVCPKFFQKCALCVHIKFTNKRSICKARCETYLSLRLQPYQLLCFVGSDHRRMLLIYIAELSFSLDTTSFDFVILIRLLDTCVSVIFSCLVVLQTQVKLYGSCSLLMTVPQYQVLWCRLLVRTFNIVHWWSNYELTEALIQRVIITETFCTNLKVIDQYGTTPAKGSLHIPDQIQKYSKLNCLWSLGLAKNLTAIQPEIKTSGNEKN